MTGEATTGLDRKRDRPSDVKLGLDSRQHHNDSGDEKGDDAQNPPNACLHFALASREALTFGDEQAVVGVVEHGRDDRSDRR